MDFEKLEVWQRSSTLCVDVVRQVESFKLYAFRDQVCRSSLSIPSNIAEGMERGFPKEKCKFLGYAKGSCGELRTQLHIAARSGLINEAFARAAIAESKEISAMLNGLIKKIQEDCRVSEVEPHGYCPNESE